MSSINYYILYKHVTSTYMTRMHCGISISELLSGIIIEIILQAGWFVTRRRNFNAKHNIGESRFNSLGCIELCKVFNSTTDWRTWNGSSKYSYCVGFFVAGGVYSQWYGYRKCQLPSINYSLCSVRTIRHYLGKNTANYP